jgi:hypothetical protein
LFLGEFSQNAIPHEGTEEEEEMVNLSGPPEKLYGPGTSVFSFTSSFSDATNFIDSAAGKRNGLITIDGGPHTFWW